MVVDLSAWFADGRWWVLPLLIFFARICDVTLGTLRVMFVSRGLKWLAPVVGFFEVLIWITAIAQIMRNLDNWVSYVAYAAGYGLGTFVGMHIEGRLALGSVLVRVIPQRDAQALIERLREENFGVTTVDGTGAKGPVTVLFTLVRRSDLPQVLKLVRTFNPRAFFTIEDVRGLSEGIFPVSRRWTVPGRPGK